MKAKIVSAAEAAAGAKGSRKSPAHLLLESLDGNYMTFNQLAKRYGVHVETLRRLCRTDRVNAPSEAVVSGEMTMYLFNEADVAELDEYFDRKGHTKK